MGSRLSMANCFKLALSLLIAISLSSSLSSCTFIGQVLGDKTQEAEGGKSSDAVITFTDVVVSVELHDSSVFATTLRVEGNVTNNTSKTLSVTSLPLLLETYESDVNDVRPTFGNPDSEEKVYDLEPGETASFYYLSFPKNNYSDWDFEAQDKIDLQGLDGVADDIEYKLDAVWNEYLEITREDTERRRAENQAAFNRCYVTPNGNAYHRTQGCRTLSRSSEIIEMTREEAEAQGYVACEACY